MYGFFYIVAKRKKKKDREREKERKKMFCVSFWTNNEKKIITNNKLSKSHSDPSLGKPEKKFSGPAKALTKALTSPPPLEISGHKNKSVFFPA